MSKNPEVKVAFDSNRFTNRVVDLRYYTSAAYISLSLTPAGARALYADLGKILKQKRFAAAAARQQKNPEAE